MSGVSDRRRAHSAGFVILPILGLVAVGLLALFDQGVAR